VPDPDALQDPDDERNLFAGTVYEADDEEADRIWESVDERMESRRRSKREAAEAEAAAKERARNPKIQTQFADLKRNLATLKDEDWLSIPEAGNLTGKRRKHNLRMEENQNGRSYAVSDSVLKGAAEKNEYLGELDKMQQEVSLGYPSLQ
jgi:pre-mRNA-processing factor 6